MRGASGKPRDKTKCERPHGALVRSASQGVQPVPQQLNVRFTPFVARSARLDAKTL